MPGHTHRGAWGHTHFEFKRRNAAEQQTNNCHCVSDILWEWIKTFTKKVIPVFLKVFTFKGKSPCEIRHKSIIRGWVVGVLPPGTMLFKRQRRCASENLFVLHFRNDLKSLLNNEIIERYAREKENWYALKIWKKYIVVGFEV